MPAESATFAQAAVEGELSLIEFHPDLSPVARSKGAETWLEGTSNAVERLRAAASAAAQDGSSVVVVQGEPGSGKRRTAQWLHRIGRRGAQPALMIDAASSEILGQIARLRQNAASNGSLLPGNLLVRNAALASHEVVDRLVDFLAVQGASLRCGLILLTDLAVGELRARSLQHGQLLGRASESAVVSVPPLRARHEDVPTLARRFLAVAARRFKREVRGISPQALARLETHPFPGNVRELAHLVEQAVLRSSGDWITAECFPGIGAARPSQPVEAAEIVIRMPGSSLREIELQALRLALRLAGGRIVRASELLGITRHALRRKLEKYKLTELRYHPERPGEEIFDDGEVQI